ncbi:MAG TPA: hypothetical protein VEL31_16045 [Ktedonobacteraceae bacterium]|nr:hypothetical protein [Ktedonobacteraceae bacterium]
MRKRYRQQQTVESDRAPYQEARYSQQARAPRETGGVRWTMVLCVSILGLLIIGAVILGIMSLADVIHGHPGMTWQHFTAWLQSNLWWLIGGPLVALVVFKVVLPVHETRAYTAVERAEARRINEETKRLREIRYHNEEHMPDGYIPLPDALGNYGQVIHSDRRVTYLLPGNAPAGNAGINPKHLMDFMERMRNVVDADEYEEEEPRRIAPSKILLSQQIERGETAPDEEQSVFGYPIDTYQPMKVLLFDREQNFVNSLFIIGEQGQGKSTIGSYFAALTVFHRGYILLIDPDAEQEQSLYKRLGLLKNFLLCEVADTPEKAERLLDLAEQEIESPGEYPLLLLVDEFSMIMRQKKLGGKWQKVADRIANTVENYATRGRKRLRRAIVFGQISNATRTGGTELRDACAQIVFKTPYRKAALVLGDAEDEEIAELAPSLTPGMAIVLQKSDSYIMQFTFPDERGLQIIAEVRAESDVLVRRSDLDGQMLPFPRLRVVIDDSGKDQGAFNEDEEGFQDLSDFSAPTQKMIDSSRIRQPTTGKLEGGLKGLEKTFESLSSRSEEEAERGLKAREKELESPPAFSEEEERQITEIARIHLATYGRVIRSRIPAAMNPPRNNAIYPTVKYICDREGWFS